ncbi:hypothetical protein M3Y99_01574000 [Aphelenchoides fujianensis]|nr:hypothetical protein M3Y99_01574000 [Aphelenchoides fujianensis]
MSAPTKTRPWRCSSKAGDIHIWERINEKGQKLRQFRFGAHRELQIITAVLKERDVVEDVYEGGFTVWHGALHALSYFSSLSESELATMKGKRCIEIGCGNGVLGIYALLYLQAFEVFFQDLNYDVLQWCTSQNLELNEVRNTKSAVKLLGGPFSLILTSDTVYRTKNYPVLHRIFDYLLDHDPQSKIFVSGKNLYFGNDGGILSFHEFVQQQGKFTSKIVHTDEISVPHTLLQLQRIPPPPPPPPLRSPRRAPLAPVNQFVCFVHPD